MENDNYRHRHPESVDQCATSNENAYATTFSYVFVTRVFCFELLSVNHRFSVVVLLRRNIVTRPYSNASPLRFGPILIADASEEGRKSVVRIPLYDDSSSRGLEPHARIVCDMCPFFPIRRCAESGRGPCGGPACRCRTDAIIPKEDGEYTLPGK